MKPFLERPQTRRDLLRVSACGFGSLALAALADSAARAESTGGLETQQAHFPARAKRVIFLFMQGGPTITSVM